MKVEINGRYLMPHDYDNEEWRRIKGFRKYLISNYCRVKRKLDNKILKPKEAFNKTVKPTYYIRVYNDQEYRDINLEKTVKAMAFSFVIKIAYERDGYLTYNKKDEYIYGAY